MAIAGRLTHTVGAIGTLRRCGEALRRGAAARRRGGEAASTRWGAAQRPA